MASSSSKADAACTHDNSSPSTSSSTSNISRPAPSRPTALLTKSWTSASVSPSTTSSRITVGANTSTAADVSISLNLSTPSASSASSTSTRAPTPIPEPSFSPSTQHPSTTPAIVGLSEDQAQLTESKVRVSSRQSSDRSQHNSEGAFNDAAEDEPEVIGITTSSSIHALDLLHRVNDKAAADRAIQNQSLRSRWSQLSVSRASSKFRSRSNSRDASSSSRAIPKEFVETQQADPIRSAQPQELAMRHESVDEDCRVEGLDHPATDEQEQYADRKYYILSSAGKPIYISHASLSRTKRHRFRRQSSSSPPKPASNGDEEAVDKIAADESDEEDESATTQVGVMQALISIFADEDFDKLRFIRQGDLLIAFLLRSPLYLVCVSNWNEEPSTLRQHLEYLYLQVISLVSASQLSRLFGRMPNFDLRRLLEGTEGIFNYLVTQLNANETDDDENGLEAEAAKRVVTDWASCHQWWLQALQPIRITMPNLRDQLTIALQPPAAESSSSTQPHRPKDLLYVLLIANGRVVTLLRPRKHSVHPIDLLLLINTVMGSRSIKRSGGSEEAEIWLPFSMPKFAPQGFVHAYVKFLDPESWTTTAREARKGERMSPSELAVIVVTADKDAFPTVSAWISSLVANSPSTPEASNPASMASTKYKKNASQPWSTSKLRKGDEISEAWHTTFQRLILALARHLSDPINMEEGSPRVSAYTCAELGLPGLRHFVYRSNSTIQLTSPTLPEPYSINATDRKRLFTLYSLVHNNIHHPVPPTNNTAGGGGNGENITSSNPTIPAATLNSTKGMLEGSISALGFGTSQPQRPLLDADRRLKMQLVKTEHEQVLGWITSPFELYLCVNPQVSKSAVVAIANGLTKWIKTNEKDLFLVNAGSF
ncbi:related to MON1 - required for fusion of cvt-vesicles and autophagosomes with the vacuole [Melanopsichium pennsylvanicum]|uniref:Vacuolar fusion protein MON1 n=2 Tax=Melanopsichium pennsylvanicum TaxID=63383 RepID=A0AAJ4XRM3_9BASI|nr:related to MON1 - required for fusion of cvt-vesicles and autophagosomes with the vacuole [Melanopsichium pennsylvanicum]